MQKSAYHTKEQMIWTDCYVFSIHLFIVHKYISKARTICFRKTRSVSTENII